MRPFLESCERTPAGLTVWLTGLPCSGKTTIARLAAQMLADRGERVELVDGDELRKDFSAGIGFSREERRIHLRRAAYLCHLLTKHGVIVVAAIYDAPWEWWGRAAVQEARRRFIERYALGRRDWLTCWAAVVEQERAHVG